jgi:acyl carrier protein
MWADVLNLDEVGIDDDFFEIGGHSILVTQLVSRLRVTFQIELPMRAFFESPTVAQLAKAILSQGGQGEKAERIAELLLSIVNCSDDEAEAMLRDDCYSGQGRTQE